MNRIIILCIGFIALNSHLSGIKAPLEDWFAFPTENADSLPTVLAKNHSDLIAGKLRFDAAIKFGVNQLHGNLKDWETYRVKLKNEIIEKPEL